MYYAFYVDKAKSWNGPIELRGLQPGHYQVTDYETGKQLGQVDANDPKLTVSFSEHLLLEVSAL